VKAVGTVANRPDAILKTKAAPKVLAGQEVLADRTMNVAVPVAAVLGATAPLAARGRTDQAAPVGVDLARDDEEAAVVRPDRRLLTESLLTP
jgi:hypothetical protein